MKLIRELYRPEVAMLPLEDTSRWSEGGSVGRAFSGAEARLPLHFGTFLPLKGTPEQLAALVDGGVQVARWTPGETIQIDPAFR